MRAIVLGAAAGGGFPQWNSNAPACRRARSGDARAHSRTQASLAVAAEDDGEWLLLNASPDLRQQIEQTPALHPKQGLRSSPIAAVALTGADVDAIAGLLTLRERHPFTILAGRGVHAILAANPIFGVLAPELVERRVLEPGVAMELERPKGLAIELFAVPGKTPLYLEEAGKAPAIAEAGEACGVSVTAGGRRLVFLPGCAAVNDNVLERLDGADVALFDGTLFTDDEMIRAGLGAKSGLRMGHISVSGPKGAMAALAGCRIGRRIFVHINNSNPILLDDSAERAEVEAQGWEVAYDGMEIRL
jgi:pyrroloquinoline quinone biosynthesis protein B